MMLAALIAAPAIMVLGIGCGNDNGAGSTAIPMDKMIAHPVQSFTPVLVSVFCAACWGRLQAAIHTRQAAQPGDSIEARAYAAASQLVALHPT